MPLITTPRHWARRIATSIKLGSCYHNPSLTLILSFFSLFLLSGSLSIRLPTSLLWLLSFLSFECLKNESKIYNKCTDLRPLQLFSSPKRPDRLLGLSSLTFNWYCGSFRGSKVAGAWSYIPHLSTMLQLELYLYSLVHLHGVERDKCMTLSLPVSRDFCGDIPSDVQ
jgi:hypothetical protein